MVLAAEQQVVHLPVAALVRGGLGGERRGQRVGVHVGQRPVPEDQPDAAAGLVDQGLQHRGGGRAVGALEVAVLQDGDRGGGVAVDVVVGPDGEGVAHAPTQPDRRPAVFPGRDPHTTKARTPRSPGLRGGSGDRI
ncbi:hypothetical protein GCM10011381_19630 [Klenkia taihuensis]|nr:hypothetical protein GCM10011381_19630 [Klenkia taihuensis]